MRFGWRRKTQRSLLAGIMGVSGFVFVMIALSPQTALIITGASLMVGAYLLARG